MDHDTPRDRRHPRVAVHDLRRDLRDADQDRYRLTSELESHRRARITSNRLLGAMIIVAGGLTSGLWLTLPQETAPGPTLPRATDPLSAATGTPASPAADPSPSGPVVAQAGVPLQGPKMAAPVTKPARAPRSRADKPRRTADAPQSVNDTKPARELNANSPSQLGRARPRPLSPGEFGRQATL